MARLEIRPATLIKIGLPLIAVVFGLGYAGLRTVLRDNRSEPWNARMAEFLPADLAAVHHARTTFVPPSSPPNWKSPIIPIDVKARRVDPLYFRMPRHIRSSTPDDVKTVVWLEWSLEEVDKYSDGTPARIYVCDVTILEKTNLRVISHRAFRGRPPPERIKRPSEAIGEQPMAEIFDYLRSLSREDWNR